MLYHVTNEKCEFSFHYDTYKSVTCFYKILIPFNENLAILNKNSKDIDLQCAIFN